MTINFLADHVQPLKSSAIRELLRHSKMHDVISLGGGIPNPELFDNEGLNLALEMVMNSQFNEAFQYGLSEGYPLLRYAIRDLCQDRGILCQPDDILITSGSQQSLDLLARALINPMDKIVVERPTYLAALQVFELAQADIHAIETDQYGMKIDELETLLSTTTIKAIYIVPTFGNPSGITLIEKRRKRLVELSKKYNFLIFEDDPYSEINFTDRYFKSLHEYATELGCSKNIIHTSTFSKVLAPGLRIGWLIAPNWIKQQLINLKQATDLHSSSFSQVLIYQYLQTGRLENQINLIRKHYKQKCNLLCEILEKEMGEHLSFNKPLGGMFLWSSFKYDFDTTRWLNKALKHGVVYVPGEFFYNKIPDKRTLRMSYVTATDSQIEIAVKRLKNALI
ncbi:PLP-dependent aminotransferase family protein [Acinetobacter nosocomialis]|uniref:aminotransferase-like domain-containing protein n=1 Tax=Acinetobacter nosocomialis TaxID=106654 RepID=UPI0026FF38CD|nr:PLP-dependent aminotransferase family protein [Acinetobacter nosocomialis]MDO7192589.1 PLP-dependent aminotransferase family protein [Acinetobacter nosocomialis]MDX7934809.1 PLP-dependent aminotransferase family protein [Acinetobacter baumannii]